MSRMETNKFVYYREDDMWVGWLEEYPDYRSQGETLDELKENLKDIYEELAPAGFDSPSAFTGGLRARATSGRVEYPRGLFSTQSSS